MNVISKKKDVIRDDTQGVFETIRVLNNESLNQLSQENKSDVAKIANKSFCQYVYFYTWVHKKSSFSRTIFS